MSPAPVTHFEILGTDGASLACFYRDSFGWPLHSVPMAGYDHYAYLPATNRTIGGAVGSPSSAALPAVVVYVEVPDLTAAIDRAVAAGGRPDGNVTALPGGEGTYAHLLDPAGNRIGIMSRHP
ncbi:hypothetical protein P0W64_20700 [Tsukamurella sp. 8F]|uniref:VOC family protein n=1 Tax=unclassified Tsukamurella TaxID=2633480 RepID=UPI0023B8F1B6|nr:MULTISPECIES: VOC family protein [unclassified Tsukamurella]MDF0532118.1 hypothetical protein [Tsukamurella sp. 8J]MDF0589204.1 hypothetical protein [Tsukamurella sp. 8F]